MRKSFVEWATASWRYWYLIVAGIVSELGAGVQWTVELGFWDGIEGRPVLTASGLASIGLALLLLASFLAFHDVRKKRDELAAQLDSDWRTARKEFHEHYLEFRNEIDRFLTTVKNFLITTGERQVTSGWHNYFPEPHWVDAHFYYFAVGLWNVGGVFSHEGHLLEFKKAFRTLTDFFERVYDLERDFPKDGPQFVEETIRPQNYDLLHVVWYLAHASAEVTYGDQKAEKFGNPGWLKLWRAWNPGVDITDDVVSRMIDPTVTYSAEVDGADTGAKGQ